MTPRQVIKLGYILSTLIYIITISLIIWLIPWHSWLSWIGIIILTFLFILAILFLVVCIMTLDNLPVMITKAKQAWSYISRTLKIYCEEMISHFLFPSSESGGLSESIKRRLEDL